MVQNINFKSFLKLFLLLKHSNENLKSKLKDSITHCYRIVSHPSTERAQTTLNSVIESSNFKIESLVKGTLIDHKYKNQSGNH